MFNTFKKYGYTAGEISPRLYGRSDLELFDLAFKSGLNWMCDTYGSVLTRPGMRFIAPGLENSRFFSFKFNADEANNYLIIFTANRIYFIQDGVYVRETSKVVSGAFANTINCTAHGYSAGEYVLYANTYYKVASATTNSFTVTDFVGNAVDFGTTPSGFVARLYSVVSPYSADDLQTLDFSQSLDTVYICHNNYARRKLSRTAHANWSLSVVDTTATNLEIFNLSYQTGDVAASSDENAGFLYAVSCVDEDGRESFLGDTSFLIIDSVKNFTIFANYVRLLWSPVAGASYYKIYRSIAVPHHGNQAVTYGETIGYIGRSSVASFLDNNIVPDFSQTPLRRGLILVSGAIYNIRMLTQGSGYSLTATTVTVTDSTGSGSGFEGKVVVNREGTDLILGVLILNPGKNYETPVVTFGGPSGSGATATAKATPLTGLNPACSGSVQQRRIYAGTLDRPNGFDASRIDNDDNFDESGFARDDDPYSYNLSANEVTPIRHIRENPTGMLLFTESNIVQVRGEDDRAIRNSTIRADSIFSYGVAHIPPINIGREFLFLSDTKDGVQTIRPSQNPIYYQDADISRFSEHLFSSSNPIIRWTWARNPHKVLWAVRQDGTLLCLTFNGTEGVTAWTRHDTAGRVLDVMSVRESNVDRVYLLVERYIQNTRYFFIEQLADRSVSSPEDMFAVDCGLSTSLTYPAQTIFLSAFSGTVTITAAGAIFSSGDVDKHFRCNNGFGVVTAYTSTTQITVNLTRPVSSDNEQFNYPFFFAEGEWSLTSTFSTFSGFEHLEGKTVDVLADGRYAGQIVVSGGEITLPFPASYVIAGLPYEAYLESLPPVAGETVLDLNLKRIVGLAVRLDDSRGLLVGDGETFYPIPDLDLAVSYDTAPPLKTGLYDISISMSFKPDATFTVKKGGPQHATILGAVYNVEFEQQA